MAPKTNIIINQFETKPGDLVHCDQGTSSQLGRLMTLSGKNNNNEISVFTLFVDSISKKMSVHFHTITNAKNTLKGKAEIEQNAEIYQVKIKNYRADNGTFRSAKSMQDIKRRFALWRRCLPTKRCGRT